MMLILILVCTKTLFCTEIIIRSNPLMSHVYLVGLRKVRFMLLTLFVIYYNTIFKNVQNVFRAKFNTNVFTFCHFKYILLI